MNEFEGIVERIDGRDIVHRCRVDEDRARQKVLHGAAFTIETIGEFPRDRLDALLGKRVRVTILDGGDA